MEYEGGKASGFKNVHEADSYETDGNALFRVHGTSPLNTLAIQVHTSASSLNSEDCFILVTTSDVYVWQGQGSNSDEKAVALNVASILAGDYNGTGGRAIHSFDEGSEVAEFWSTLGGISDYPKLAPGVLFPREPRLFECSNASGSFKVTEVNILF
jgi:hypothetical protein